MIGVALIYVLDREVHLRFPFRCQVREVLVSTTFVDGRNTNLYTVLS